MKSLIGSLSLSHHPLSRNNPLTQLPGQGMLASQPRLVHLRALKLREFSLGNRHQLLRKMQR